MRIIVALLSLFFTVAATAQVPSTAEAKAAYLLAEESFAANDYKGALSYLAECRKKIGTPNCKILYLQLMAELELAKTDSSYYKAAVNTIVNFEKAPDVSDFNEEKTMEVMKTKLRLNRMLEGIEKDRKANEERAAWIKTLGGVLVSEKDGHGFVMAGMDIGKMNFEAAKKACEDLVLNGYDDWRLPTLAEFQQMISANLQFISAKETSITYVGLSGKYWTMQPWANDAATRKFVKQEFSVRPVRSF